MSFITCEYFDVLNLKNRKELKNNVISISLHSTSFHSINFKKLTTKMNNKMKLKRY